MFRFPIIKSVFSYSFLYFVILKNALIRMSFFHFLSSCLYIMVFDPIVVWLLLVFLVIFRVDLFTTDLKAIRVFLE